MSRRGAEHTYRKGPKRHDESQQQGLSFAAGPQTVAELERCLDAGLDRGQMLRDAGIARADAGAPRAWKLLAWEKLQEFCRTHMEFNAPEFARLSKLPRAPEPRALGGLMVRAKKAGWIISTGDYEPSDDPGQHLRPVLRWRSRIYGRAA